MRHVSPRAWLALIPLVVAAGACELSSDGPRDREQAAEGTQAMMPSGVADSIARAVGDGVSATFATGAAAATGMPAHYAPDAVLSDETELTHAGQAAIARTFSQGMPPGASLDIRSSGAIGSGDLVVDMGSYTFRAPNPQGGPAMSMNGRYMVVIQRMSDGSWKIVRQIGDVVGMGGALPAGPPPTDTLRATIDSAAAGAAETGFTNR